jgi:hypothetical protein
MERLQSKIGKIHQLIDRERKMSNLSNLTAVFDKRITIRDAGVPAMTEGHCIFIVLSMTPVPEIPRVGPRTRRAH